MTTNTQMKVTPVMLAKKMGVRPQQIFNWVKQGCPSYQIAGKTHVVEEEVMKWDSERAQARADKIKHRIANPRGSISEHHKEILKLLSTFKPQMIEGLCENCVPSTGEDEDGNLLYDLKAEGVVYKDKIYYQKTIYHVDLSYDSTESWNGNYVVAWCTKCLMNHRFQDNVPAEVAVDVLRGNRPLWFPEPGKWEDQFGKFIASRIEETTTDDTPEEEEDDDAGDS